MGNFETKPKRIAEMDYMKGLGILLIMVFHLVFRPMLGVADYVIKALGWAFIGIFFLLAGYNSKPDREVRENYKHRIVRLLIPVVITEFVLLTLGGIYCILVHHYKISDVFHDAVVIFLRPELSSRIAAGSGGDWGQGSVLFNNLSPVWYVWSMVWTELFFHPLRKLIEGRGEKAWIILFLILLAIQVPMYVFLQPAPWSLTIVPTFVMFMLIGAKLREWDAFGRLARIPARHAVWISILCFAAHFGLFYLDGDESYYASIYGKNGAWDVFAVIIQAVIFFPAIYFLARGLGRLGILSKAMSWLGRHTIPILLMHDLFAMVYADILHNYIKPGPQYWYLEPSGIEPTFEIIGKSILTLVLSLLTCIPMAMLWDKAVGFMFKKRKKSTEA